MSCHLPVIEYLASEYVPADSPAVGPFLAREPVMSQRLTVQVVYLETGVVYVRFLARGYRDEEDALLRPMACRGV
jgi:hypothetical protein